MSELVKSPNPEATDEVVALVDYLASTIAMQGSMRTMARLPTEEERIKLQARQIALQTKMRAVSYTKHGPTLGLAGAAIAEMFQGFITWKPDPKIKEQSIGWYVHELSDLPLFAIEAACMDVRMGRVPDLKPDFPPSSARMVQLAREHMIPVAAQYSRVKAVLQITVVRRDDTDPEMAARVSKNLRELADNLNAKHVQQETEEREKIAKKTIERNQKDVLAEYAAHGLTPIQAAKGITISMSLAKNIEEYKEKERQRAALKKIENARDQGS